MRSMPLAALLATLLSLSVAAHATAEPSTPQLAVQGEGWVEAVPDIVVIQLTAAHTADTLVAAKQRADAVANAIVRAANQHGIKDDDLQASKIQAAPEYDWRDGERVLRGQRITRESQLRLRDVERYGALMQALTEAEVTEINAIRMEFSKEEELANKALAAAIANARSKAGAMAAAFDVRLGRVLQVNEGGAGPAPVRYEMRADFAKAQAADGGDAGLKVGKQRITRSVQAVFELAN